MRYKLAAFYKFGIAKGYLILTEKGEVCSSEEALTPFSMFITFNSYMTGFYKEGKTEVEKPKETFRETIKILEEIKPFIEITNDQIGAVTSMIYEIDNGYNRLKELYLEATKTFEEMYSKKMLDQQVVNKIVDLTNQFTILQYKHLNMQLDFKEPLVAIVNELKKIKLKLNANDKKKASKAEGVLRFLTTDKYRSGLIESLKRFETDGKGGYTTFYSKPNWEQMLIANGEQRTKREFEHDVLPMLRN
jgi:hypothetical protein